MARRIPRTPLQRKLLCTAIVACFPLMATANPLDPTVASGSAIFNATGNTLRIENSPGAVINWRSFSIGSGELTHFQQPSAASQVLNRVTGGDPSVILGRLTSNGHVFLLNPNGIAFGPGSTVDVAGLVASTLNLSNADFLAGRLSFSAPAGAAGIRNDGTLQAATGGRIYLVAPTLENHGIISAPDGSVVLAAGHSVTLIDSNRPDVQVLLAANGGEAVNVGRIVASQVGIYGATIRNDGSISATTALVGENGNVVLKATSAVITGAGSSIAADGGSGGKVDITTDLLWHAGSITTNGGNIQIAAGSVFQSGAMRADGAIGGTITILSAGNVLQTESSILSANGLVRAGEIRIDAGTGQLFSSGRFEAMGATGAGGRITLTGDRIALVAASADASGATGGGAVRVGGDFHGAGAGAPNSQSVYISDAVSLRSDATGRGDGGTVVVWSDGSTRFAGSISVRGGANGGDGGMVEVSGAGDLRYSGNTDATAPRGLTGSLLLDPKNIIIADSAPGGSSGYIIGDFIDPNPTAGGNYGLWFNTIQLFNGNLLVEAPNATVGSFTNAGAAYLFNGTTRALIGAVTGGKADDRVGGNGTFFASNGNYIVRSEDWNGGAGALTFGTPSSLASGVVGASNSLVGGTVGDHIGNGGIGQIGNGGIGNTIWISSPGWTNPETSAPHAGAFTLIDANTGATGTVSALNSLVGSHPEDGVGDAPNVNLSTLESGNFVLLTAGWNSSRGAATFINLASPVVGAISDTNSLVGATVNDGNNMRVQTLQGDDYAVIWPGWTNPATSVAGAGAITFNFSSAGTSGVVGVANSLVVLTGSDGTNESRIITLTGGANINYLVANPGYANVDPQLPGAGVAISGAVTFVSRTNGIAGEVSEVNSLVGGGGGQRVGDDVRVRNDGNYLVVTPNWHDEVLDKVNAGAVTFGNGATGVVGRVSASNSLVGDNAGDQVGSGGIYNVANGNYVVASPEWNSGRGAVTWANGSVGVIGTPGTVSSLRGSTAGDRVGSTVTVLPNQNYVVQSSDFTCNCGDAGSLAQAGAVTWVAGATGFIAGTLSADGAVGSTNSLIGTVAGARVGSGGILQLSNNNYLVLSPDWTDNGLAPEKGAVTYLLGDSGNVPGSGPGGSVRAINSLVGKFAHDRVGADMDGGLSVHELFNGSTSAGIVVRSPRWNSQRGAVTWMSAVDGHVAGQTGPGGVVDIGNSVVGSSVGDQVGEQFRDLGTGVYLIGSPHWSDGAGDILGVGAVTQFRSATGELVANNATFGAVSSANSLVGPNGNENIGRLDSDLRQVFVGGGSRFLLYSPNVNTGAGALTWLGDGSIAVTGIISASNSLVGAGVEGNLSTVNDTVVVSSAGWNGGRGAVTFISSDGVIFGTGGNRFGTISATNSLVGSTPGDNIGYQGSFVANPGGTVAVVGSSTWNGIRGAMGFFDPAGAAGVIGASNSLVGSVADDRAGSGGFTSFGSFSNQQRVVLSPDWNGGRGAMTYYTAGTLDAAFATAHGVVGSKANDHVGSGGLENVGFSSAAVLKSPQWNGSAGAVTYLGDGTSQVTGAVSAFKPGNVGNSIVGSVANQRVGGDGVLTLSDTAYLVLSSHWTDNASANLGAITWADATTGRPLDGNGVVSRANSLVGPIANAGYGGRFSSNGTDVRSRFVGNTFYLFAPTVLSASAAVNGGRLMLVDVSTAPGGPLGNLSFATQPGADITLRGVDVAAALAKANLILEANNDITLATGTNITVAGTRGHDLTLRAGRSVLLNGNITTANGDLTVIANEQIHTGSAPTGVVAANRDSGRADITMAPGTAINAGSGNVRLEIHDGRVDANGTSFNTGGDIRAADIRGANIALLNRSLPGANIGSIFLDPSTAITTTAANGLISISTPSVISVDGPVRAPNGRIELRASLLQLGSSFVDGGTAFDAKDIVIAPDSQVANRLQVGGIAPDAAEVLFVSQAFVDSLKATGTLTLGDVHTFGVQLASNGLLNGLKFGPGSGGGDDITGRVRVTGNVAESFVTIGGQVVSRTAGLTFDRPVILNGDLDGGSGGLVFTDAVTAIGTHSIVSTAATPAVAFQRNLIVSTDASLSLFGPMNLESLQVTGGSVQFNGVTTVKGVNLSAGGIDVPGTLRVTDFTQTGGGLSGNGNFVVTHSFNVARGTFDGNWKAISITHRTGDLVLRQQAGHSGMNAETSLVLNATAGRLKVNSEIFSADSISLNARDGIAITRNVVAERNLSISTPGGLTVDSARVTSSFGAIAINAGSLSILAGEGPSEIAATTGRLMANVVGDVTLRAGNGSTNFARIGSFNAECTMNIGGDLRLAGGNSNGAFASVFGTPDVGTAASPLRVGGGIFFTTGSDGEGGGGVARIEAARPDTIHLAFPTRSSGGYLVNGKAVVADGNSGFFAGGKVAILDQNLLITYGEGVIPDPSSSIVTAGERGVPPTLRDRRKEQDDPTLPSCR